MAELNKAKNKVELLQLKQRQSLPLEAKIILSQQRIRTFHEKLRGQTYISFSGGKDSTVLLHLVRELYPDTPAVFVNTGLEYPEIVEFVKTIPNVTWLRPKMNFKEVLEKFGYPIVSKKVSRMIHDLQNPTEKNINTRRLYWEGIKKDGSLTKYFKLPKKWRKLVTSGFKISDKCCYYIKKQPFKMYQKETKRCPFNGTMASDSAQRKSSYLQTGCNSFVKGAQHSQPIAFWLEQDIWNYIKKFNIPYSKIYDMGEKRTGCMFCMFGVHLEKNGNRFQRMKKSHPKQWDYCINKLGCGKVLDYIDVSYETDETLF